MRYVGQYSEEMLYMPGDVVAFRGSSFVAIRASKNVSPIESGWSLVAAAGRDGNAGKDGRDGVRGKDGYGVPDGGDANDVLCKVGTEDHQTGWRPMTIQTIGAAARFHEHQMGHVAGLEDAIAAKANASHRHRVDQIDGLDALVGSKAPMLHRHLATDVAPGHMNMVSIQADSLIAGQTMVSNGRISHDGQLAISVNGVDRMTLSDDMCVFNGQIHAGSLVIVGGIVPQTKSSAGKKGQVVVTSDFLYVCVANNSWKRVALQDW